ncbi:hypothetical protein WJX72_001864 [[Myrmecia] bisecta]|uniref:BZIP domain-containing protein n=1 Tax=[Myrmecia] bisecta TaxID=41462 RepID=A0AAW1QPB0_9CHLO
MSPPPAKAPATSAAEVAARQGLGQLPSVPPLHQPAPQPVKQQPQAHSRRAAEPAEAKPKQERPVLEIKEGATKAEIRRARRMLSNRESARRSRRRKQEHLSTLEEQVNEVTREKEELLDKLDKAEEEAEKFEADNKVLKRRVEELEQEVESLRSQRGEVGSKMPRSPSMQRTASLEPLKKRAHTANGLSVKQEEANGRQ